MIIGLTGQKPYPEPLRLGGTAFAANRKGRLSAALKAQCTILNEAYRDGFQTSILMRCPLALIPQLSSLMPHAYRRLEVAPFDGKSLQAVFEDFPGLPLAALCVREILEPDAVATDALH